MKLTVKTVKGQDFKVEAAEGSSVTEVKARIEESMGSAYPKDNLLLIYKGKVLKDDATLAGSGVEESGFVVVMVSKAKKSGGQASGSTPGEGSSAQPEPQPQQAEPTPSDQKATPREVPQQAAPEQAPPEQPAPVAAAQMLAGAAAAAGEPETVYGTAASTLATGSALEESIRQICDMGFPKEQVVRAMRAAFNNPDRAVEYLMSGIPEGAEPAAPQRAAANQQAAQLPLQPIQPPQPMAQGAVEPTGPNAQPLDMFGGNQGGGGAAGGGPLDYLRGNAQFQTLRQMVAQNPQILQPMLQELGKNNPELLQQITDHQEEFLRLLTEDPPSQVAEAAEGLIQLGQGGAAQMAAPPIEISPEDEAAITRLQGLGFERALCIEAFFSCDKNEDLAANYLLEHAEDL